MKLLKTFKNVELSPYSQLLSPLQNYCPVQNKTFRTISNLFHTNFTHIKNVFFQKNIYLKFKFQTKQYIKGKKKYYEFQEHVRNLIKNLSIGWVLTLIRSKPVWILWIWILIFDAFTRLWSIPIYHFIKWIEYGSLLWHP